MKAIFIALLITFISIPSFSKKNIALVYNGSGACEEDCAKATARVARAVGMSVKYVTEVDIDNPNIFENAAVWMQPGGDALIMADAISVQAKARIRSFIESGGAYVGICAGAFLADKWVDNNNSIMGLDILAATSYDYTDLSEQIMVINWSGEKRFMYFEGGGYFVPHTLNPLAIFVSAIANYTSGEMAAVLGTFGKGKVAVSGPHPEALDSWKPPETMYDPDGDDLVYAQELLNWAIK